MAAEQDISSIGLDISSFSEAKKVQLKEFLALFNKLDKYDKKVFNPLLGEGLTKLNTSVQETNRLLEEMNTRVQFLVISNNSLVQAVTSGSSSVSRQAASLNSLVGATNNASNAQGKFVANTYAGKQSLEGIGTSLTHLLTNLRYVAYILPGIGIAGIFNLAYTAIASAANAIIDFRDKEDRFIDTQNKVNDSLKETIKNFKELYDIENKLASLAGGNFQVGKSFEDVRIQEEYVALLKAEGIEKGKTLQEDIIAAQVKIKNAKELLAVSNPDEAKREIQTRTDNLIKLKTYIDAVNHAQVNNTDYVDRETKRVISGEKDIEKLKKSYQSRFETESAILTDLLAKYKNYYDSLSQLEQKQAEQVKFNSDQERSILVENIRSSVAVDLKAQQDILNNDKKFYEERRAAILQQFNDEKRNAEAARISVTGTDKNPNVSATRADKINAIAKQASEEKQAEIKKNADLEKNDVEFYQRKLKALTDINIDQVKSESDKNQKIANNEQKSLDERLRAYLEYIKNEQDIADYEFARDIQRGAAKFDGKTSLTPEESHKIEADRAKRKEDIIADSEKRIYDIVFSSQSKIIEDTKKQNDLNDQIDLTGHIKALRAINKEFEDKKISLKNYRKEKAAIELQYERSDLDQQIVNDRIALQRAKVAYIEKIQLELDYRKDLLKVAEAAGDKKGIEDAKAAVKAAKDAVDAAQKYIHELEDKLHKDEKTREGKTEPAEKKDTKASTEALRALQRINDDIRRLYDERIEAQIQFIEKKEALIDREYGYERDAIEQSSLSLKDKQALEIQIQEQQQVLDENATREEISLKIKKFEFDKKIALANAAIGIASAIIKDGITSPKAIADIVIGAAEIGVILAEQAPTFGEGVEDFEGGWATTGEKGPEAIKEPGKKVRIVTKETFSYLKPGTDVIPLTKVHPEFGESVAVDDGWEQTRYLAKQMKKNNREIKNIFRPTIVINGDFERRKNEILGR